MTDPAIRISEAGIRQDYPEASERETFLRSAARRPDREVMVKVYGWYPELAGK